MSEPGHNNSSCLLLFSEENEKAPAAACPRPCRCDLATLPPDGAVAALAIKPCRDVMLEESSRATCVESCRPECQTTIMLHNSKVNLATGFRCDNLHAIIQ
jgi:hypothetical protein